MGIVWLRPKHLGTSGVDNCSPFVIYSYIKSTNGWEKRGDSLMRPEGGEGEDKGESGIKL